jgi:hypothetical protein
MRQRVFIFILLAEVFGLIKGISSSREQTTPLPTLIPADANFWTPAPTETYDPGIEQRKQGIYRKLVEQIGVESPVLDQLADEFAHYPQHEGRDVWRIQDQKYENWYGKLYKAIRFDNPLYFNGVLLLERNKSTVRIISGTHGSVLGFYPLDDRNHNGKPDFAFGLYSGGNCCPPTMIIEEIQPDGQITNLTPKMNMWFLDWIDINGDGMPEVKGERRFFTPGIEFSPHWGYATLTRWFGWDGNAYTDSSKHLKGYYQKRIASLVETVEQLPNCSDWYIRSTPISIESPQVYAPLQNIAQAMVDAYAIGEMQQVWDNIKVTLREKDSNCPKRSRENEKRYQSLMDNFQQVADKNNIDEWSW